MSPLSSLQDQSQKDKYGSCQCLTQQCIKMFITSGTAMHASYAAGKSFVFSPYLQQKTLDEGNKKIMLKHP